MRGLNISNAICNLLNVVFIALGNAVGIIIGQFLGAGEYETARKSSFKLMWFTGIASAVLTVILVSLSGEVRPVRFIERRIKEMKKFSLKEVYISKRALKEIQNSKTIEGIKVIGIEHISEAVKRLGIN